MSKNDSSKKNGEIAWEPTGLIFRTSGIIAEISASSKAPKAWDWYVTFSDDGESREISGVATTIESAKRAASEWVQFATLLAAQQPAGDVPT